MLTSALAYKYAGDLSSAAAILDDNASRLSQLISTSRSSYSTDDGDIFRTAVNKQVAELRSIANELRRIAAEYRNIAVAQSYTQ